MDDDEYIRYLVSYLISNSDRFITYSFDRNGSHAVGGYKEFQEFSQSEMEKVIKEFNDYFL